MKKEKGPAPPPPSMPNSTPTTQKESIDEKIVLEATLPEESDNKPNQKATVESPTTTTPEVISSRPEVN